MKHEVTTPRSPGRHIKDLIRERKITQTELAQRMGRARNTICKLLQGKLRITPETAARLEKVLETPPAKYWLDWQQEYDERRAADKRAEAYFAEEKKATHDDLIAVRRGNPEYHVKKSMHLVDSRPKLPHNATVAYLDTLRNNLYVTALMQANEKRKRRLMRLEKRFFRVLLEWNKGLSRSNEHYQS